MSTRELCKRLLSSRYTASLIQQRGVVLVERIYEPPLAPKDKMQSKLKKQKYQVYKVLDHGAGTGPVSRQYLMSAPIQCVLVKHVDGVGTEGDVVTVTRKRFHRDLLPSGSAVYASPENLALHAIDDPTRVKRTKNALTTLRTLFGMTLKIPMNTLTEWTLDESHIQIAFRLVGIWIENKESISLPEEPITNHHDFLSPFYVEVKINGLDEALVECYIQPHSYDEKIRAELPSLPDMPTFRPRAQIKQRLIDDGVYYGTVDKLPETS